ncbi:unnamed protein product, partial [marine sediment metagenome]
VDVSDAGRVNWAGVWDGPMTGSIALMGIFTPPAGATTIIMRFKNSVGASGLAAFRRISAFEMKK